jgi:hypothetical protein
MSPALPKVWAWPLDTLTKSPGPAATAAPSSSTMTVPSSMKNASEQFVCRSRARGDREGQVIYRDRSAVPFREPSSLDRLVHATNVRGSDRLSITLGNRFRAPPPGGRSPGASPSGGSPAGDPGF